MDAREAFAELEKRVGEDVFPKALRATRSASCGARRRAHGAIEPGPVLHAAGELGPLNL